ncbi:MAG TPA: UDP-3-O-(3-hydroxymyristoyl)glucosamine N-acyltransferase [Candidatus Megaira endosymbiont of Nemacystus decipiens]|nr:UDP-3-O-(3-hydroxymyristoyl)glucosamine N-acyltransferase [Candidatus Megaera endosymbiont of Nemacystus decipiens]
MSNQFYKNLGPYSVKKIADLIDAKVVGDQELEIHNVKSLDNADKNDISFFDNKRYMISFESSLAGACIVSKNHNIRNAANVTLLQVENPYFSYARVLDLFYESSKGKNRSISPSSTISKSAKIGSNCSIGHNVVIEDNVQIGNDCIIGSGTYIDHGVVIGDRARIDSNVVISHAIIENDVVILPGASIGQDGFGFATHRGVHKKILHIGKVLIGNNVEIGANTCIDRGSMQDTVIEDLCRIDNLVQIGHNVHVKRGTVLVAQVGIAGSSKVGQYCAIGGQVGIAGHVKIADQVNIAGQSGVIKNITVSGAFGGSPAVPIKDWHRQSIIMKKLVQKK